MPGSMPYVLDKGPYFSVVETLLDVPAFRAHALLELRSGTPIADLCGFDSTSLDADGRTPTQRRDHLNREWFAIGGNDWWVGYDGGDTHAILREAMERAIEVSFGIDHGAALPNGVNAIGDWETASLAARPATRHWPINVNWICQGPWFQCWVL